MHALAVYNICSDEHGLVKHEYDLLFCILTLSCLIELLPFGPLRPCHLPFAMALSLTLRSLRVNLSQTRSMLAYLHSPHKCLVTARIAAFGAASTIHPASNGPCSCNARCSHGLQIWNHSSHVFLLILCSHNAVSEGIQGNFSSLPSLSMTSITSTDRQCHVYFLDGTLKMRDSIPHLHKSGMLWCTLGFSVWLGPISRPACYLLLCILPNAGGKLDFASLYYHFDCTRLTSRCYDGTTAQVLRAKLPG